MLDVEFDFFDPQTIDYHSIKLLLQQLLSHDSKLIDLSAITNLILDQKLVGSTVKTDGAESDPYALLTVLNLNLHKVNKILLFIFFPFFFKSPFEFSRSLVYFILIFFNLLSSFLL